MKKKILHITPHLGGGIGKAISGTLVEESNNTEIFNKLLVFEKPENPQFAEICEKSGFPITYSQDLEEIKNLIEEFDVIILHWWHHPLIVWFFLNFPQVKCRVILWCHINGCTYPKLPFELVESVDTTFFTSKYSMSNPQWTELQRNKIKQDNVKLIYGVGKFKNVSPKIHKKLDKLTIGYVGTINFSKLNLNFVEYCAEVLKLIKNTEFVLVGEPECKAEILKRAKDFNIEKHFRFTGYTKDVNAELENFDIFGYLLNPEHYGTTENVILEAINFGIPVVTINQGCEKYLIKNNKTGFLVNNKTEYAQIVKNLYENADLRNEIAKNAKEMLKSEFSLKKNIENIEKAIDQILLKEKSMYNFKKTLGETAGEMFLKFLPDTDYKIFKENDAVKIQNCRRILKCKTKSSISHFYKYFPNDERIRIWYNILER